MLSSRAHLFPNPALGSVTINGQVISKGEVIQAFGELRIDCGSYPADSMLFFNDDILWTPVSIDGNTIVLSLNSNGRFRLYDTARNLVFYFSNDMQQEFSISDVCSLVYPSYDINSVLSVYSYAQLSTYNKAWRGQYLVRSTLTDIQSLSFTATNGAIITPMSHVDRYGVESRGFVINASASVTGEPVEVKLGGVLVLYIERVTA